MRGRDGGHAQVDVLVLQLDLDASVKGNSFFGNIHVRHDFETACDVGLEVFRGTWLFAERTVDAVADAVAFFHRLHVNVGRLHVESVDDDLGDEFDDWSVFFGIRAFADGSVLGSVGDLLNVLGLCEPGGGEIELFDVASVGQRIEPVDLFLRRDDGVDVALKNDAEGVDGVHVGGVPHCDGEDVVVHADGNDFILFCELGGDAGRDVCGDFIFRKIHEFKTVLFAEHGEKLVLVEIPEQFEGVDNIEFTAGRRHFRPALGDLVVGDKMVLLDQLKNVVAVFRHFSLLDAENYHVKSYIRY